MSRHFKRFFRYKGGQILELLRDSARGVAIVCLQSVTCSIYGALFGLVAAIFVAWTTGFTFYETRDWAIVLGVVAMSAKSILIDGDI